MATEEPAGKHQRWTEKKDFLGSGSGPETPLIRRKSITKLERQKKTKIAKTKIYSKEEFKTPRKRTSFGNSLME